MGIFFLFKIKFLHWKFGENQINIYSKITTDILSVLEILKLLKSWAHLGELWVDLGMMGFRICPLCTIVGTITWKITTVYYNGRIISLGKWWFVSWPEGFVHPGMMGFRICPLCSTHYFMSLQCPYTYFVQKYQR